MDTLHTRPVDIEPADPASPWQAFRIQHPGKRSALLQRLLASETVVTVASGQEPLFDMPIWSMDMQRGLISLQADHRQMQKALPAGALWAVSYLDQCKVQFELLQPRWHQGAGMGLLKALLPDAVFALQRRGTTRLRLPVRSAPVVYVPLSPDGVEPITMLAINLHAGGCALWKPGLELPLEPGRQLRAVEVQLDDHHILVANLQVRYVNYRRGEQTGTQIGCAWEPMTPFAQQTLDAWLARHTAPKSLLPGILDGL
jgi:c-di-GMP-binding flagellar brake protein YcgR